MSLSISTKKSLNSSTKERRLLVKASKKACIIAVKNSKKLGLAITFLENGTIYKELPNGERVAVKKIKKVPNLIDHIQIRKGTILNAKF
jgi:hypothetical protein